MAERFEKPEKFTKEWFSYIWCYYKVHFFVIIAIIILSVVTISEIKNKTDYDIRMVYCTTENYSEVIDETLPERLKEEIEDVNGDGEKHFLVSQINFSEDVVGDSIQYTASEEKLLALLSAEDEMLFVCDEYMMKHILGLGMTEDLFIPVSEWTDMETAKSLGFNYAGATYAASLKNSSIFNEIAGNENEIFIMVKDNIKPNDKKNCARFEESKKIANKIIK